MSITNITNVEQPIKLSQDQDGVLYLSHFIMIDEEQSQFALITQYKGDEINVYPSVYESEANSFGPVPDDVAEIITAFVQENPITLMTLVEIEESVSLEQ